jgi:hypothetical protein
MTKEQLGFYVGLFAVVMGGFCMGIIYCELVVHHAIYC